MLKAGDPQQPCCTTSNPWQGWERGPVGYGWGRVTSVLQGGPNSPVKAWERQQLPPSGQGQWCAKSFPPIPEVPDPTTHLSTLASVGTALVGEGFLVGSAFQKGPHQHVEGARCAKHWGCGHLSVFPPWPVTTTTAWFYPTSFVGARFWVAGCQTLPLLETQPTAELLDCQPGPGRRVQQGPPEKTALSLRCTKHPALSLARSFRLHNHCTCRASGCRGAGAEAGAGWHWGLPAPQPPGYSVKQTFPQDLLACLCHLSRKPFTHTGEATALGPQGLSWAEGQAAGDTENSQRQREPSRSPREGGGTRAPMGFLEVVRRGTVRRWTQRRHLAQGHT